VAQVEAYNFHVMQHTDMLLDTVTLIGLKTSFVTVFKHWITFSFWMMHGSIF
jgi:hypothetical protein